jgi:hypothetical protein
MTTTINADNGVSSGSAGLKSSADNSGVLQLQTNGTAAVTVDTSQNVGIGTSSVGNKLVTASSSANSKIEIQNTSTAASTSKTSALQFTGTDTVGTLKESGDIYIIPADNNYVGSNMTFYTRGSDTLAERMRIDSSGNLLFNSGYGSAATAYGCRAWVNFNGIPTVAIRASGNVTSVTRNATGNYTVNFTTAMPDINYVTNFSISQLFASANLVPLINTGSTNNEVAPTTSTVTLTCITPTGSYADIKYCSVSIFR